MIFCYIQEWYTRRACCLSLSARMLEFINHHLVFLVYRYPSAPQGGELSSPSPASYEALKLWYQLLPQKRSERAHSRRKGREVSRNGLPLFLLFCYSLSIRPDLQSQLRHHIQLDVTGPMTSMTTLHCWLWTTSRDSEPLYMTPACPIYVLCTRHVRLYGCSHTTQGHPPQDKEPVDLLVTPPTPVEAG